MGNVIKIRINKHKNGRNTLLRNTKHFTYGEFACRDGQNDFLYDIQLGIYLENIRKYFGSKIIINSGYRSPSYNRKVGGVGNSLHTKGKAADIYVYGVSPLDVASYCKKIGIKGVGCYMYSNFVHIDTRSTPFYWKEMSNGSIYGVNKFK